MYIFWDGIKCGSVSYGTGKALNFNSVKPAPTALLIQVGLMSIWHISPD